MMCVCVCPEAQHGISNSSSTHTRRGESSSFFSLDGSNKSLKKESTVYATTVQDKTHKSSLLNDVVYRKHSSVLSGHAPHY